jgi:hypothetical protein
MFTVLKVNRSYPQSLRVSLWITMSGTRGTIGDIEKSKHDRFLIDCDFGQHCSTYLTGYILSVSIVTPLFFHLLNWRIAVLSFCKHIIKNLRLKIAMSEEIEVPTEHLQEVLNEEAHHNVNNRFVMFIAMTAAILSVLAATAALFAGHHANEATLSQIQASNAWSYYQAKGVKTYVLSMKVSLLQALEKPIDPKDELKIAKLNQEQLDIKKEADKLGQEASEHLQRHVPLAAAVTLFQIGIALCAITVLTKRRILFYGSLLVGVIGIVFLVKGLI